MSNFKRKIYLLLSPIIIILSVLLLIWLYYHTDTFYILSSLYLVIFLFSFMNTDMDSDTNINFLSFLHTDMKKIYLSGINDDIYVKFDKYYTKGYVFKQGYFNMYFLFSRTYSDIDTFKLIPDLNVSSIYENEIKRSMETESRKNEISSWNGSLDIISNRDAEVDKLIN